MKKLNLMFACIGIISSATYTYGYNNPQEGNKIKKTETVQDGPVQKTKKAKPVVTVPVQKAEQPKKTETSSQTPEMRQNTDKQSVTPAQKPVKKIAMANPVMMAIPTPILEEKK